MIARKIKPGVLQILDIDLKKEMESHTLVEITDKDAYLMLLSSNGFKVADNNAATIEYESGSTIDTMFKAIAEKHKKDDTREFADVSKKYNIDDVDIPGTSVLIRDVEKRTITVARRTTSNYKQGSINRLFINNNERDKFFDDARVSNYYKKNKKFAIDTSDEQAYEYWSIYMNNRYFQIMRSLKNEK